MDQRAKFPGQRSFSSKLLFRQAHTHAHTGLIALLVPLKWSVSCSNFYEIEFTDASMPPQTMLA